MDNSDSLAHQPTTDADAEPVAWMYRIASNLGTPYVCIEQIEETPGWTETPLYAHPPADKARIAELEAALEPFTRQRIHKSEGGTSGILVPATVQDVRRARAALENRDD